MTNNNIFEQVLNDPVGVEEKLLGPTYPYYKNIKTPSQLGMSDKGTIQQMGKDIDGLISYVELLVQGKSKASATGGALGNKFFLQTGAKCRAIDKCTDKDDVTTCKEVNRYIYVNNVPQGNMTAFLSGSTPNCQEITLQTIDVNNNKSSETHYVTLTDIINMDPCSFPKKKNPLTNEKCKETFQSGGFQSGVSKDATPVMSDDPLAQLYIASLAAVGIYILYRIMEKGR